MARSSLHLGAVLARSGNAFGFSVSPTANGRWAGRRWMSGREEVDVG